MIINNEESFFNWYNKVATPDDIALMERVENFSGLFEDMLFKSGTATHELIEAQRTDDSGNVITFGDTLAGPLEGFDYSCFRYKHEFCGFGHIENKSNVFSQFILNTFMSETRSIAGF